MSYKCQECKTQVPAGIPSRKRVVKTRAKIYKDADFNITGRGQEIVKEITICPVCNGEETCLEPKVSAPRPKMDDE